MVMLNSPLSLMPLFTFFIENHLPYFSDDSEENCTIIIIAHFALIAKIAKIAKIDYFGFLQ
jgi:hypothetical protein